MALDYDLTACLEYNPGSVPFVATDIHKVLAVIEGEHDERNWYWLLELCDGQYAYLEGGCDYTGWD